MIYGRIAAARFLFLATWGLVLLVTTPVAAEEGTGYAMPSREKIAAMLTALYHHSTADMFGARPPLPSPSTFISISPDQAFQKRGRGKITAFADSLVYEGGFYPREVYSLFGYSDVTTARIARKVRQLDSALGFRPSPWEVAGRVGRSGSVPGGDDMWSMQGEGKTLRTPGTLGLLPVLAIAYAVYPQDGLNAAGQLSLLQDDDVRAEAVGRGAFSLLRQVLMFRGYDKDAWLRQAAADMGDSDSEHELRAVRVKDWRYLRGEECAMGRLERTVYLWYHGNSYVRTMEEGRKFLESEESLDYLSALAGATYGRESLPVAMISEAASDAKVMELIHDLHDLATSEAVLQVTPEPEEE